MVRHISATNVTTTCSEKIPEKPHENNTHKRLSKTRKCVGSEMDENVKIVKSICMKEFRENTRVFGEMGDCRSDMAVYVAISLIVFVFVLAYYIALVFVSVFVFVFHFEGGVW